MVAQLCEYTLCEYINSMVCELYLKKVASYKKKKKAIVFWGIITNVWKDLQPKFGNNKNVPKYWKGQNIMVIHMINNVPLLKIVFTDC